MLLLFQHIVMAGWTSAAGSITMLLTFASRQSALFHPSIVFVRKFALVCAAAVVLQNLLNHAIYTALSDTARLVSAGV